MCLALVLVGAGLVYVAQGWFSQLIFGTPEQTEVVVLLAQLLILLLLVELQLLKVEV